MNRHADFVLHGTQLVYWLPNNVHHTAERPAAYGHRNWAAFIDHFHATDHAVRRFHGYAAYATFAQVLLHFENDVYGRRHFESVADHAQRLINRWHVRFVELHVHRGA